MPADYGTTVLATEAVRFIESTPADTPLFLYFAPHAPHEPAMAAPGDRRAYTDLGAWRPPNYDEADVSDKPAYIRNQPRMDAAASARIDEFRRSQYASLLAVDRAVGTIVDALEQTGRLSNTLIVFTSDNGMLWGEHRWATKLVPYEESIHVPFIVRFDPMIGSPREDEHLVVNIDLAPTFAELASVEASRRGWKEPRATVRERPRAVAQRVPPRAHAAQRPRGAHVLRRPFRQVPVRALPDRRGGAATTSSETPCSALAAARARQCAPSVRGPGSSYARRLPAVSLGPPAPPG